ncbi:hypothetical protein ACROYT_G000676 [Oculina patagonica]
MKLYLVVLVVSASLCALIDPSESWLRGRRRGRRSRRSRRPCRPQRDCRYYYYTPSYAKCSKTCGGDPFHVTRNVVLLTARGRGTPGVRVGVAAYRSKPERCVLRETQVVGERRVRVDGVKREAATLEYEEDAVLGKIVLITGAPLVVVRDHAVAGAWIKDLLLQETRVVAVLRAHLNDIELFHVTRNVAVLTARGRGTPGVRAKVAACRSKPER